MAKPVSIRGASYPSHRAAAVAFGLTTHAISMAVRRGGLDRVGLTSRGGVVPTLWAGKLYPNRVAAARDIGVPVTTLRLWIEAGREE